MTPNRRDVSILTIFPNPVERNMNPVLMEIGTVMPMNTISGVLHWESKSSRREIPSSKELRSITKWMITTQQ